MRNRGVYDNISNVRPLSERLIPGHVPDWDATKLYFRGDRAFLDGCMFEAIIAIQSRGDFNWNPPLHQSHWRWISDWSQ
ncbi:MAG: hypothetical protein FWG67_02030 [Defluviitaleaceae bacterium]|nr:hypothetical protein [Defluviitaleaceae bacterium]